MSASPLAKADWDLPPEMKPQRPAARKSRGKAKPAAKSSAGALEVIVVGSGLKDTSSAISDHKSPVGARHMRSIDDLLAHIEDHEVEIAVVDQSKPTESRGLKLALLAAAKRIKCLIVIADEKNLAEAKAIHGVTEVIRAPANQKRLLDTIVTYACTATAPALNPAMKRMVKRTGLKDVMSSPPETDEPAEQGGSTAADAASRSHTDVHSNARERTGKHHTSFDQDAQGRLIGKLQQLSVPHHNRALLAALVPLLAIFICFGGIVGFFFVSTGWSVPLELGRNHELVRQAGKHLEDLRNREAALQSALDTAITLAAMAGTTRNTAAQRLTLAEQAIAGERQQNARVLAETRSHIARLRRIAARSGGAEGNPGSVGLQSLHQLAVVSNELAVKEIEEIRLSARESYLEALAGQPAGSTFRTLPASSTDLIVLDREVSDARTALAQASQTVASKQAEAGRIRSELAAVQGELGKLSSTLAARAWDKPVTAVFVPDANLSSYSSGMPLFSCKLIALLCTRTGKTGATLAEGVVKTHPLFGSPVSGAYVEAVFANEADAHGALVHAGAKPALF
jgi:hypothetical protein